MILNLRVDHKLADIQSMEVISKDIDELFTKLQEKYSIGEYIEISIFIITIFLRMKNYCLMRIEAL